MQRELIVGARKIVEVCLGVKKREKVLIITDYERPQNVTEALKDVAISLGAQVSVLITESGKNPGEEPSGIVSAAMSEANVIIGATTRTLWHSEAATKASKKGARLLTLTECTEKTLISGPIEADFLSLQPIIEKLLQRFTEGKRVHVTAPGGTKLWLDISGREAKTCSGICLKPGEKMGFPDVEVYIAPVENKTNGTIVIDASSAGIGLINDPIKLVVENGRITSIEGRSEAKELDHILTSTNDENSYIVAEFAFGLNDKAQVVGNIIEDEGVYGTGHFALGNNIHFGGKNRAPMHIDMVYWKPTIELDGEIIMKDGELVEKYKFTN